MGCPVSVSGAGRDDAESNRRIERGCLRRPCGALECAIESTAQRRRLAAHYLMARVSRILLAFISWAVVGPLCGAASFAAVFESPVWIFQQPESSMLGWGCVATIPALVVGVFCAGVSSKPIVACTRGVGRQQELG